MDPEAACPHQSNFGDILLLNPLMASLVDLLLASSGGDVELGTVTPTHLSYGNGDNEDGGGEDDFMWS